MCAEKGEAARAAALGVVPEEEEGEEGGGDRDVDGSNRPQNRFKSFENG